jgi:signal peptidase I
MISAMSKSKFIWIMVAFSMPGLLLVTLRIFVFQPFSIPSSSNVPTFVPGDAMLASRFAYRLDDPQRGDMAVFKLPSEPSIDYVKRVIGLPGDRVQIKVGRLFLNGVLVPREAVKLDADLYRFEPKQFYRETLPEGGSYMIGEVSDLEMSDDTQEFLVPAASYFVLGDNRDNSSDSRFGLGFVPRENFTGRYVFKYWNAKLSLFPERPAPP